MKTILILVLAMLLGAAVVKKSSTAINKENNAAAILNTKQIIRCSPDLSTLNFGNNAVSIPLLNGWGAYRMNITHAKDSAWTFFQQGINLYYSFHIIESLASFERALQFDSGFAMAHWGKALAYGPNINDLGYAASPDALLSASRAKQLCNHCSPVEKALINAMQVRYSSDSTQSRTVLNQLYAGEMKKVHTRFSTDADAAALYADALMIQHPWDLYDNHYLPKAWTPAIVQVLEKLVVQFPLHPGAAHYYIHAVEGSQHPEKALPVANRLGNMMPGVSHLVHMPSHIYIRSGYYNEGITVNKQAVTGYNNYLTQFQPASGNIFLYLMHNLHLQIACTMMDGQYKNALSYANELNTYIDASMLDAGGYFGVYGQYMYSTPLLINVRFGEWDAILQTPVPGADRVYESVLSHFARGMAFAHKKQQAAAADELQQLRLLTTNQQLQESPPAFNPGVAATNVAEKILEGVIAAEKNDIATAINAFRDAVSKEDNMLYNEPRDWLLPARQYLGVALLRNGDIKEAEKILREDLAINPKNVWSMASLLQLLQSQKRTKEAAMQQQQYNKAAARADKKIMAAVY